MLRLIVRRAAAQLPLLVAVLLVVVVGTTLLGVCALLLTTSQEQALERGMASATPAQVDVTAYATQVRAKDVDGVADDVGRVVTAALAPFPATTSTRAFSAMRELGPQATGRRWAYLAGVDGLSSRGRLTAGRWPGSVAGKGRSPIEAVVLESTARALGLAPGRRVRLGPEVYPYRAGPLTVTVVGVFQPRRDGGWDADTLRGTGYDPAYLDGRSPLPTRVTGPFVVDRSELFASGSAISSLQVAAHPDLRASTGAGLTAAATAISAADGRLAGLLGDRVQVERVATDLPGTLAAARAQQATTRSIVLVVILLGTVLTAAALGLAGRLVSDLRTDETALLSKLGAGRGQLARAAAVEAVALAGVAAGLAVPLSSLAHAGLTRVSWLAGTGLVTTPRVTGPQVVAVLVGAMLLASLLVVPVLRPDPGQVVRPRRRVDVLARSGADLALLVVAAAGWWQLRAQPSVLPSGQVGQVGQVGVVGVDLVRVLAPALCLLAGAALVLRLVSAPLRLADRWAVRSRGLVPALAAFEAARRPRAVAAGLLLTLAAAAATFAVAFGAGWQQSQQDQAAARVGTDLSLSLRTPAIAGQDAEVAAVTGGTVSSVTDRGVAIGQFLGGTGDPPRLIAVDAARAGELLRGRAPGGSTWTRLGSTLAPPTPVAGLPVRRGSTITLTGGADPPAPLEVVARMVVQGPGGLRTPCVAAGLPLDGRPHPLRPCGPDGSRVVALSVQVGLGPSDPSAAPAPQSTVLSVSMGVPGAPPAGAPPAGTTWSAAAPKGEPAVVDPAATVTAAADATVLQASATVRPAGLSEGSRTLVATAFAPPGPVPVALSHRLAGMLGARPGTRLSVAVDGTGVPIVVRGLLPNVPAAPGGSALLADSDTLSRALIAAGSLEPAVDAYWVGGPTRARAAGDLAALGLGDVVTREDVGSRLARGPLRAGLPVALALLVPAAVLLALTGTVMHVVSDLQTRAVEVARLRGLGVSRRSVLAALLAQHGVLLTLLLLAGSVVGVAVSWLLSPSLVRSDVGAAPVPAALSQIPWPAEIALLGGLLGGSLVAVAVVVAVQVRRADAAHLRVGP